METIFEVEIDDDLVQTAQEYTGTSDLSKLITAALESLIQREEGTSAAGHEES